MSVAFLEVPRRARLLSIGCMASCLAAGNKNILQNIYYNTKLLLCAMNLWKCGTKLNTKQTFSTHFTLPIKVHGYWLHTSGLSRDRAHNVNLFPPVSLVEPRAQCSRRDLCHWQWHRHWRPCACPHVKICCGQTFLIIMEWITVIDHGSTLSTSDHL